jgi:hypothetical protein
MQDEQLSQELAAADIAKKIAALEALEPTTDRRIWQVVAEQCYVGLADGDPLKEAAGTYFRKCARLYTEQLSPSFHMVPWDTGQLLEEEEFNAIYNRVMRLLPDFVDATPERIAHVLRLEPRSLVLFRMIMAYTPNQLSYMLREEFDLNLSGDTLDSIEKHGLKPGTSLAKKWEAACPSIGSLIFRAVRGELLPFREDVELDRFRPLTEKGDTRQHWESVADKAKRGVAYSALLYQRYIGSVFGQAINASSSLKADLLEGPVERLLRERGVPYYRVGTREKVPGWEQAPDFFIPNKEEPKVVIEAKVAEDGGTARDKASRIERLSRAAYARNITLISVVDGLGFYRINDVLAPILGNSKGLVYTYKNLPEILQVPALRAFEGKATAS